MSTLSLFRNLPIAGRRLLPTVWLAAWCVTTQAATLSPIAPSDDAYIDSGSSGTNYGSATTLRVKDTQNILLKFVVTGVGSSPVASAKIRLYCYDSNTANSTVQYVTNNSWTEGAVTWANAPAGTSTPAITGLPPVTSGNFYEIDVAPVVTGDGTYSFRIAGPTSSNFAGFESDESTTSANRPRLLIETSTSTFTPNADSYVNSSSASSNFGTAAYLRVRDNQAILLKFAVTGIGNSTVTNAKVRLRCNDASSDGGTIQKASNSSWTETGVTWNNAPTGLSSPVLDTKASVTSGNWYEFDVTNAGIQDGTFSFRISSSNSTNIAGYDSREVSGNEPQLVVTTSSAPHIEIPLEVIGSGNYTVSRTFNLASTSGLTKLYVEGHRIGYEEGISPLTGNAKASVRINGGSWVNLTNSTSGIVISEPELSYGGIGGGYNTVRFTIPLSGTGALVAGSNQIDFRFNGTDGITSGYRVLNFNFLNNSDVPAIPSYTFVEDDPANWTPPLPGGSDISAGQTKWSQTNVLIAPGGGSIKASCAMCHAQDGRDLKYFNYSNWSIIQRSKDHGLTQTQAEQIASYIRSLNTPAPAQARPWNPPYQPGPGMDSLPVTEWAAGAGLAAVLDSDDEMAATLLPVGADLDDITDLSATLNLRQQKVAVQFPDWNAWLPFIHPVDIWSDSGSVPWTTSDANTAYTTLRAALPSHSANSTLPVTVGKLDDGVRKFISKGRTDTAGQGNWRTLTGNTVNAIPSGIGLEKGKLNLSKWMGVKHWEVMQEFNLEGVAATALPPITQGARGEMREWVSDGQSVWANAPHMTATNKENFAGQTSATGIFLSSVWYQLQMTLNSGMRQQVDTTPVDWQYQFIHLTRLREETGQPQSLRFAQSMIKAYQMRHNGKGPDIKGWQLRYLHPWELFAESNGNTAFYDDMNTARAGLRIALLSSQLNTFMDMITTDAKFALSGGTPWPRRASATVWDNSTHDYWYALEPTSWAPQAYGGSGQLFVQPDYNHADAFYRLIPRLYTAGVNTTVLQRVIDWCKLAWPNPSPSDAWDHLAPDDRNPSGAISAPAAGATLHKSSPSVSVQASAADNVGVLSVQFRVDGANLSTADTSTPYSKTWNISGVSNGNHTLSAVVTDINGNTYLTSNRTVNVQP